MKFIFQKAPKIFITDKEIDDTIMKNKNNRSTVFFKGKNIKPGSK